VSAGSGTPGPVRAASVSCETPRGMGADWITLCPRRERSPLLRDRRHRYPSASQAGRRYRGGLPPLVRPSIPSMPEAVRPDGKPWRRRCQRFRTAYPAQLAGFAVRRHLICHKADVGKLLRPFFDSISEECGLDRPDEDVLVNARLRQPCGWQFRRLAWTSVSSEWLYRTGRAQGFAQILTKPPRL
jgi:hypothetical protein